MPRRAASERGGSGDVEAGVPESILAMFCCLPCSSILWFAWPRIGLHWRSLALPVHQPQRMASGREAIVVRTHTPRPFAKAEGEAGPQGGDLAAAGLIPATTSARPHGVLHILLQTRVEFALHVGPQIHRACVAATQYAQAIGDVLHL